MNDLVQIGTRPVTRGDCVGGLRPCPWASCPWHVAQIHQSTQSQHPFADDEVPDLEAWSDTCVLDVCDRGGATLEETGAAIGLTRERIRQIERRAERSFETHKGRLLEGWVKKREKHGDPIELAIGWRKTGSSLVQIGRLLSQHGHEGWPEARVRAALISRGVIQAKRSGGDKGMRACAAVLRKAGRWMGTEEIAEAAGLTRGYVANQMRRLRKAGRVESARRTRRPMHHRWIGGAL